jgi:hypothetical protein
VPGLPPKKGKTESEGGAWKDKGRKRHSRRRNNTSFDMDG